MKMHDNFKSILRSRFLVNLEKRQFEQSANFLLKNFLFFFWRILSIIISFWNNKKKGSPGLSSCKSLREFRYSHARIHAFKNTDLIRSAVAHELFWLPLTASCARAGILFYLLSFGAKTSFTVVVVVKDNFLGLPCRIFTQILGRFAMFYESFIRSRWLHDRSNFPWNLGNTGFPKQFFLNTQNWLKLS